MVKLPNYIKYLYKKYPKITSGRKNFKNHHLRIHKTLQLIKKYFSKSGN